MRNLGAGGTKQTDSIGWKSKSIEQSRWGGGKEGQGERRREGNQRRGPGSDHNAGFWRAVGNKVGLPGSAPQKKVRLEESGGGIFIE